MPRPRSQRHRTVLTVDALEARVTPSTTLFVLSVYSSLLHRGAGPEDLAYWITQLERGSTPSDIAAQIVASPEYERDFIRSSYQLFLNHNPSTSALSWWLSQLQSQTTDPQAEAMILASPEFVGDHPGDSNTWINAVYEQVLGRPADPAALAVWDQALQKGAANLDVALAIVNTAEANSRVATDAYHELLGRDPESAALAYWEGVATQPQGAALILSGVAGSDEYVNRADGTVVPASGAGTGPFYSEPYCSDPYQFANLGGGSAGNTSSGTTILGSGNGIPNSSGGLVDVSGVPTAL